MVRKYTTPAQKMRPLANGTRCPPARIIRRLPIKTVPAAKISHEENAIREGVNSIRPPPSSVALPLFRNETAIRTAAKKTMLLVQNSTLHCMAPFYRGTVCECRESWWQAKGCVILQGIQCIMESIFQTAILGTRGAMRVNTSHAMVAAASAWSKAVMVSLPDSFACSPRITTSSPCSTPGISVTSRTT
jgi:hypothetical protein